MSLNLESYGWALLASFCAIGLETFYRATTGKWLDLLPITIIPILVLNFALFHLLRSSGSLLTSFVTFALCNMVMRIMSAHFLLHEKIGRGLWVSLVLLLGANLTKFWK